VVNKYNQNIQIGILGGGQLGRMLIQSAIDFNLDIDILDPDPNAPCSKIAHRFVAGQLTDFSTVYAFGKACDIVTIEIEHVNTEALKKLEQEGVQVYPQPNVIELIQDKRKQKQFYKDHDIPTSVFTLVEDKQAITKHADFLPAMYKLGKAGYDGRGVHKVAQLDDLDNAFDGPGLLEKYVDFEKELSVIVARNADGDINTFPVVELSFHPVANLVEFLFAPADIPEEVAGRAEKLAVDVIRRLDMVGLLAVEMFLTKDGQVLVNEIAPRPHNSGHQTIEGSVTSQFEQHLRAILNMPLGSTRLKSPSAMINLLGAEGFNGPAKYEGMEEVLAIDGAHVHLYGKKMTKPFRKMGHVTLEDTDTDRLKKNARKIKETLKVIS